jgi:type I restriction enzyme S subunit
VSDADQNPNALRHSGSGRHSGAGRNPDNPRHSREGGNPDDSRHSVVNQNPNNPRHSGEGRNPELPEGWIFTELGNAIEYGKCEKSEPTAIADNTWVLELEDIEKDSSKILQVLTFKDRQSKSTKNKFKKGDVLYGKLRPYLNKVAFANKEGVCTTEIVPLTGGDYVNNKYLFYWLKTASFLSYVTAVGYGVNMPRLGTDDGKAAPFVLAPLAEQQQIAKKLDELLAQVDTLKTRLDAIPSILKRFRQSVLVAAVSGKLTEEWRREEKTYAHTLMESWGWPPIPNGWVVDIYENLVDSRLGKMLDKAKNTGLPTAYLGNINVRWDEFDLENLQEILISEDEQIELALRVGDVFICEGGEPGRCAIWKKPIDKPVIFQKALHRARVRENLLPDFLVFNLKNDSSNLRLEQLFTGTTIKHLTGKALKKYPMRVPPVEEQTEIVHRVEQLFAFADHIEQRVKDAQARVNHLTQSILAKAFRGELTADWRAQNPDLISGENSAAALLQKIKAEREATAKPKRKLKA